MIMYHSEIYSQNTLVEFLGALLSGENYLVGLLTRFLCKNDQCRVNLEDARIQYNVEKEMVYIIDDSCTYKS